MSIKPHHQFLIVVLASATISSPLLPSEVKAFWPFSSSADAAANVITPGSSTPALQASTNIDPNPNKGLVDIQTSGGRALLAYGGPSGTAAGVVGTTQSDRISLYVVRAGDTLSDIADMYGVSVNTIVWANDLSGLKDVHPGDTLIILPISGVERTVAKGDTLESIAKKFGGDVNEIAQFNGIDPAEPLTVGSTLIIPGGEIAPAPAAKPRTPSAPLRGGGAAANGYFINPVPGGMLTQGVHGWNGVDIGAARGAPIYAAAGGRVIIARTGGGWNGGYGNYVVISHDNGSQTLYSHMRTVAVSQGQFVSQGTVIGSIGSTGHSTGPHLHFEVRGAANPLRFCTVGTVCIAR